MKNPVRRKVFVVGACTAAFVAAGGAGTAFAGEVTGNGKPLPVNGKSICAFSGQNDEYQAGDTSAPRVQSFGQIVRFTGPLGGVPGQACNPNGGGE